MINSVTVLGGGTAGLINALLLRSSFPQLKIDLIESSNVGIIGVGEGSTEHWRLFMNAVGITLKDLVIHTGATFKSGIKFDNWNGDGKTYYHGLTELYSVPDRYTGVGYTLAKLTSDNVDPLKTFWKKSQESMHSAYDNFSQYHFDTFKLNAYFHKLCLERNITIYDADIDNVQLDEQGYVKSLNTADGQIFTADFFIDCSGFKRVISSKLGAKWISCADQLPMNSAMAFPTAGEDVIPSWTLSEALSSGWRWRIPTQDRFGNGYVFCDAFIDETKAYDEIQSKFKEPIQIGKKIKFSAGYVDQFWIKNCVSAGLAGMFVEPLEASSIGSTIQQARGICTHLVMWNKGDTAISKKYNVVFEQVAKNIIDFIQIHYFTQRADSEFWKWCKTNIKLTDFNRDVLPVLKDNLISAAVFDQNYFLMFLGLNYSQVMHGVGLLNNDKVKQQFDNQFAHFNNYAEFDLNRLVGYESTEKFYTHRQALDLIKDDEYQRTLQFLEQNKRL